jgi:hypothetical protein
MSTSLAPVQSRGLALMLGWRRVVYTAVWVVLGTALLTTGWQSSLRGLLLRTVIVGVVALVVFGVFEQWPRRLPSWVARWALQVVAVGVAMPTTTFIIWVLSTPAGAPPFWHESARLEGFGAMTALSLFFAPWAALGALVRQKEAWAREQALAFDLERSEFERQALDSRLRLLQAQVAPHFLFNTLANVQALVETHSPRAPEVLQSLIGYLRAAVPRLDDDDATIARELELVEAYLKLMHMRIPDRLSYTLQMDDAARELRCPPMTVLTLVENAVRHGIDPSEDGGRIEIDIRRDGTRCHVRVQDSGVGLREAGAGLGTGLANLRERLRLFFGDGANLQVRSAEPQGVRVDVVFPAQETRA